MTLSEFTDDIQKRPLLPMPAAKGLAVVFVGVFAFFAVWVFDANAKLAEMSSKFEQMQIAQIEMTKELRETNRQVQRLVGALEAGRR